MNTHFKVLYATYYQKVYNTCLLILKNHSLAEDATQEAFLKAYKNIDKLKEISKFGAWIASIASNCAIDIYRANEKVLTISEEEVLDYLVNKCVDEYNNPSEMIEKIEISKEMRLAIAELKPPLNQLIILKYYWELTDKQISDMLNMPIGTVKSSLYKSRRTLSRVLPSISKDYLYLFKGAK